MNLLRERNPNAKLYFYQWDSFNIYKDEREISKHFDRVFSFQLCDCKDGVKYLPNPHFSEVKELEVKLKNGIYYIGIFTIQRYRTLNSIAKTCKERNIEFKWELYSNNFLIKFIFGKNIINRKVSAEKIVTLYKDFGVVLDLGQSNQSGVTQRFFESLSLGCSVISFSPDVSKFQNMSNMVLTYKSFRKGKWFDDQKAETEKLKEFISKYHIDNWINEIFKKD
ncbi:hypothetical protein CS022_00090 [Veronia nyctiphanis]|uniref:Uncharacterized protein n=1 Tax=Veronia nyctiphanis TaxID=1278244 RepID=A0A4Q0YZV6_9GAMM|nr:hypothetical protein [Veronia nyctiphanis]RXJ74691.1 hypothetical protein CS022_00090 [Veronia nyctiphanis]